MRRSLRRVIAGSDLVRTRFHDQKGNLIDLTGMLYAPLALSMAILRKQFHYRFPLPWTSFRGIRELKGLIRADWKIVEFGSGMSSIWFARRCAFLHSIESNERWYRHIRAELTSRSLNNVRYELRTLENYADLSEYPDGFFDLAFIDGENRAQCVNNVLQKVRYDGWIYLDNSDFEMTVPDGDTRQAEAAILHAVAERHGEIKYFTDFLPGEFSVEQALLAKLSGQ